MTTCKLCKQEVDSVDEVFGFCKPCKKHQERVYDNHVDPSGFYQNKNFELE